MGKGKKRQKNKSKKKQQEQPAPEQSRETRLRTTISKTGKRIVGGLSLFLGLTVLVHIISPFHLSQTEPLNSDDPFSAPFTLSNDWYFPIYEVRYECILTKLEFDRGNVVCQDKIFDIGGKWLKAVMSYKEKADVFCSAQQTHSFDAALLKADISMQILYRVKFMPWNRTESFSFRAAQDSSRKWRWLRPELKD